MTGFEGSVRDLGWRTELMVRLFTEVVYAGIRTAFGDRTIKKDADELSFRHINYKVLQIILKMSNGLFGSNSLGL